MDRVAVLVDTGYLVAATATLFDTYRTALAVRYAELIPALLQEAADQAGVPPLRLLWYDGAFNAVPFGEQHTIRLLPDVKLRLGILVKHGGRVEQKGVDSLLQRDLTTLARNGAISDAVLLGGDEDLRRGVEEAQEHGVRVHLWGVAAGEGRYNQAPALRAEADRLWTLEKPWLERYVSLREPVPDDREVAAEDAPEAPAPAPPPDVAVRIPSPAAVARIASANVLHVDSRDRTADSVPRLRDITSVAQREQDDAEDEQVVLGPADAGSRWGRRWRARAPEEQRQALLLQEPMMPKSLDVELLGYANAVGVDTWGDESVKLAVRRAAWDAILEE